jgi:hypothetical protein
VLALRSGGVGWLVWVRAGGFGVAGELARELIRPSQPIGHLTSLRKPRPCSIVLRAGDVFVNEWSTYVAR